MTPPQYSAPCSICGLELDVRRPGTFQYTSGWAPVRDQGGANTIALAQRENRYACRVCIDLLRRRIAPTQGGLW